MAAVEIYRPRGPFKAVKMIFDSGTTYSYFPQLMYLSIMESINHHCAKKKKHCGGMDEYKQDSCVAYSQSLYPSKEAFLDSFPPIEFVFAEKSRRFVWFPRDYLHERKNPFDEKSPGFCNTINMSDSPNSLLLGAMFMRHYDIYFDRVNEKISFVRAHCDGERVESINSFIASKQKKAKKPSTGIHKRKSKPHKKRRRSRLHR